jgi:peptidoglycan hydrolase CwlO-like protein
LVSFIASKPTQMSINRQKYIMEKGAANITKWVGSAASVIVHTILFIVSFALPLAGIVSFERMLLVLTTIVSLEAIYLSIFIQMSINMNNQNIGIIQEDIEGLGEDIEELGEDIEELGEDIEELGEDIDEIGVDLEELGEDIEEIQKDVDEIQEDVVEIQGDVVEIQGETNEEQEDDKKETEILLSIQATLVHLQKEIEQLKVSGK